MRIRTPTITIVILWTVTAASAGAQIGVAPLSELLLPYLGSGEPGLYPGGANVPTGAHLTYGATRAGQVVPRATDGSPADDGWIGVAAMGMSNTNQEWSRFERESDRFARHAGRVVLVDLAQGGIDAARMADSGDSYWDLFDQRLEAAGLSPGQLQVVWLKQSIAGEATVGAFPGRIEPLRADLRAIVPILVGRCPNLQLVFLSSRLFAGYSGSREPFAYETAFAVKGLIQNQFDDVDDLATGPWLGWGPYPWADGPTARGDGLVWQLLDLEGDQIHPAPTAEWKIATLLHRHFSAHSLATGWFSPPDDTAVELLDAVADAEIDPTDSETNFGTAATLNLEAGRRVFLRFDLTAVTAPVLRAKLSLLVDADAGLPSSRVYALPGSTWDESTITWSSAPTLPVSAFAEMKSWSRGAAPSVDVSSVVLAALLAKETSITLVLDTPVAAVGPAPVLARESGEPPRLVLTLDAAGAPPPLFVDGFETGDTWPWS